MHAVTRGADEGVGSATMRRCVAASVPYHPPGTHMPILLCIDKANYLADTIATWRFAPATTSSPCTPRSTSPATRDTSTTRTRGRKSARGRQVFSATSIRWNPHRSRSEEHTSELQSRLHLVCRLLL